MRKLIVAAFVSLDGVRSLLAAGRVAEPTEPELARRANLAAGG